MAATGDFDNALARSAALEAIIDESEQEEDAAIAGELVAGSQTAVEVIGRHRYFNLRDKWSRWITGWITGLIGFNVVLTFLVGFGVVDYTGYEWFIAAVTVQTFLQVVGLGYVAVRYLFADTSRQD